MTNQHDDYTGSVIAVTVCFYVFVAAVAAVAAIAATAVYYFVR
jgi:hypothetical protein